MELTLYWITSVDGVVTSYYPDKYEVTWDMEALKAYSQFTCGYRAYKLKTALDVGLIFRLLNGTFNHCMLPNYRDAKCIDEWLPDKKGE